MNKKNNNQKLNKSEVRKKKLEIMNENTAGIDLGSRTHYVCVPKERDEQNIQQFGCCTYEIKRMAGWFKKCKIKSVAMESTGVEWVPVYEILEQEGFDVKLVNARDAKNVPGRKTDVQDCEWLQKLHSYGLLRGSFRPENEIVELRGYVRQRYNLIKNASIHINRMQKALTQMNVQLHKVISDITGVSGQKIITAILNGNRNTEEMADMIESGIKAEKKDVARALEGNYRKEHLFTLKQEYELYQIYRRKIVECDLEIERYYSYLNNNRERDEKMDSTSQRNRYKYKPNFDLQWHLKELTGNDFTKIDGLHVISVQNILSEIGLDASKWPTEKHFTSWLGLCPNNKITGGKILSSRTRKVVNRAAMAFRQAASTLLRSKSALGAYHRRMRARLGPAKAITAVAHKLARIFYRILKYGEPYVDIGAQAYEEKMKAKIIKNLKTKAKLLGFELVLKAA